MLLPHVEGMAMAKAMEAAVTVMAVEIAVMKVVTSSREASGGLPL